MVVIVLTIGAFCAGEQLRDMRRSPAPVGKPLTEASALLKLTPESAPVTLDDATQGTSENRELLSTIYRLLRAHYVEPITKDKETTLARGAVRGMLDSLNDPDSRFLDPTERKLLDDAALGKFHGIGAVLALRKEKTGNLDTTKVIVIAPMPGSPAEKAGLQPGDSITDINSKWIITHDPFKEAGLEELAKKVRNKEIDELTYQKAYEAALKKLKDGMPITDALEALTAKSTNEIALRIDRAGEKQPVSLKLHCGDTNIDPVAYHPIKKGIAYIRITQFNKLAESEFATQMNKALAGQSKGLVLDLRNNAGGLMDAATDIAGKITGGGVVGSVQTNADKRPLRMPRSHALNMPVVVLVNGGTASVAELVAGTLHDGGTATLVGTKTFGDGLVQTPLLLKDGSAAVLTTGKMITAKGVDFNGKGLQPDKVVQAGNHQSDAQLDEAVKILQTKLGKA